MKSQLRILHLEDDPSDAELVKEMLAIEDVTCEVTRVENEADFSGNLQQTAFDLILADYTLPSFDGLTALKIARNIRPSVPFIFVAGTMGEEIAIEALKMGATDYIFKTRLSRILPSVQRALRESRQKAQRRSAIEELRAKQELLDLAQKAARAVAFDWHIQESVNVWSPELEALYGLAPGIFDGTYESWKKLVHPEDWPLIVEAIKHAQRTRDISAEYRVIWPDGSIHWLSANGQMFFDDAGRPFRMVGFTADITARKLVEQELRRSEAYLSEAQRLSHTGSFGWNVTNGEIYWSEETFRIFECDRTTKPTVEFVIERTHPDDRAHVGMIIERAQLNKESFDIEHRLLMPDGSTKHLHVMARVLDTKHSSDTELVGAVMDVTEQKQAETALRRSEGYLAEAQRLTHSASWAWNTRTQETFWSAEMYRILGYDSENRKPSLADFFERVHPEDRSMIEQRRQAESTQPGLLDPGIDYRIVLEDGTIKRVHSIAHPVLDESGEIVEVIGTTMDVTEQHEAKVALETALEQIKALRDQLYRENIVLREEVDKASMFEEIVGDSPALKSVLARVEKVARTDSTVLVTGETGTGKELIARAIHKRSLRSNRPFVSVNCAAIPATLIASELFGHEKGAFTGALHRRLGRFEVAEGGTLFLDEVGELPAETQVTLLRVLQEREFERVGGSQPIGADIRVISATNRNMEKAIANGVFRQDLFYRLNVFPISIPSLRERKEDIPTLIEYFIHRYSRKAGKKIGKLEKKTLELLESYSWPGNIRELQNVIERSIILCDADIFSVDPSWLSLESSTQQDASKPIERPTERQSPSEEKEQIEKALAASGGRVSGPFGAATQLGMPPSTLESKIKSLKINKYHFKKS